MDLSIFQDRIESAWHATWDQNSDEFVVAVEESGQLGKTAPVVDGGLGEGGLGRWPL
jgi:hypothetical protein